MTTAGQHMLREMQDQPAVLAGLWQRRDQMATVIRGVTPQDLAGVLLIARGSSDIACTYARYLLELATGRPVALAAPSLFTRYGATTDLHGWLAVGVSQSGETPEIVATLAAAGQAGAATLAVTNTPDSALERAADGRIGLHAGQEVAVPATKTFTAQIAAFALLAQALGTVDWAEPEWIGMVAAVQAVLDDARAVDGVAAELSESAHVLSVGRGLTYAAALESGLKLAETTGIHASGYSPADLLHGPIAIAGPRMDALVWATPGPVAQDVTEIARDLDARGVRVHAICPDGMLPDVASRVSMPADLDEALAPVVQVVRGQQLARAVSLRRGIDPDQPRGLSKVTHTR